MLPTQPVAPDQRIASLDILRGFALLGILTMNITAGLPGGARLNPLVTGGFSGIDFVVWVAGYLLFDEKMITVFSMLFGAGLLLVTERAEKAGLSPRRLFYRRSVVLLLIGLAHAYLLWEGDIVVTYALCGMAIYPPRLKAPRKLLIIAAALVCVGPIADRVFGSGAAEPGSGGAA